MSLRLVVLGWGNESRGDDAIGPRLLARIAELNVPGLEIIEGFQLQIENALDLRGADLALFVDAGSGTPTPFCFYEAHPAAGLTHTTHALAPEAVLDVYRQVQGEDPPPAFVLCVRGAQFDLGQPMSEAAQGNLEAAWRFIAPLCAQTDPAHWRQRVRDSTPI